MARETRGRKEEGDEEGELEPVHELIEAKDDEPTRIQACSALEPVLWSAISSCESRGKVREELKRRGGGAWGREGTTKLTSVSTH